MKPKLRIVRLSDVLFDKAIYPRKEHDPQLVQKYANDMESIEAQQHFICLAQDNRIIDGRHRHLAYLTLYLDEPEHEIQVYVYPVANDGDVLDLAADLNSAATWQMTEEDKHFTAIKMHGSYGRTQEQIAKTLKVGKAKVGKWLKAILDNEREQREDKIWGMWLSCHKQQVIADAMEMKQSSIAEILQKLSVKFYGNDPDIFRNFKPQVYTVWNFSKLTNKTKVFGSIPQEIIDNLLYYYTEPFNIVFDPFGGGGSTIDVCIKRKRRYYVSDLSPIPARDDIREWDITQGLPDDLPVPDLVFLDPPYWKQAEKKYSEKDTDLGNMSLETFLGSVGDIAKAIKRKWGSSRPNGRLAIICGLWKNEGQYIDLPFLCYNTISKYLELDMRIQVPYSTQVHGGNYVKSAKTNKEFLYLSRDLMIFKRE